MADQELSIEETNKLRASLGLAPLEVENGPTQEETAEANLKAYKADRKREKEAKEAEERIATSKSRLEHKKRHSGKSIAEEGKDLSAAEFIKKNRERMLKNASKSNKNSVSNSKKISKGVDITDDAMLDISVAHDHQDFEEGDEAILTLKDKNILEEDDDELINAQLVEREKLKENLDNKKKKNVYNPYDDENDTITFGQKKTVLSKYDDEIDGPKKKKGFRINANSLQNISVSDETTTTDDKGHTYVSLDFNNLKEISDYYTKEEADIDFKKTKSKKKKIRRKNTNSESNIPDPDGSQSIKTEENEGLIEKAIPKTLNFVDDDDLQKSLTRARRIAREKVKVLSDEQLVSQIQQVNEHEMDASESAGIVISETSEFVQKLGSKAALQNEKIKANQEKLDRAKSLAQQKATELSEPLQAEAEPEAEDEDITEAKIKEVEALIEEDNGLGKGLAAALGLLARKGIYVPPSEEQKRKDQVQVEHAKLMAEQRMKEARRSKDRESDRRRDNSRSSRSYDRHHDREEDLSQKDRNFAEAQMERMSNYRPTVTIEHFDNEGNKLGPKEAFREISHKFHGKTSGPKKTEKRMAKRENEKKQLSMSTSDLPSGTAAALAKRQKVKGTAHIVLDKSG